MDRVCVKPVSQEMMLHERFSRELTHPLKRLESGVIRWEEKQVGTDRIFVSFRCLPLPALVIDPSSVDLVTTV